MGTCQGTKKTQQKKPNLEIQIPNNDNLENSRKSQNYQPKSAIVEKKTPASSQRQSLRSQQFQFNSASSDQALKSRFSTPMVDLKNLEQDQVRTCKHKTTFKMNATVKKVAFSKFYSVQQSKKNSFSKIPGGSILVQHNMTGKLHYADILENTQITKFYVDELLRCQLQHPNITNVIEILEDKSQYIVIKECAQGVPISYLESPEKQASILKQIIEIVCYLHSKNLIHGALWLGAFERNNDLVKLVDIQSIFIRHEPTNHDAEYVAPECTLDSTIYTKERDIWAVGMIAHNLICGRYFKATNAQDIIKEIEQVRIKKHLHLDNSQIKEFLEKFLHITPEKRIALQEALKDQFLPKTNEMEEFDKILKRNQKLQKISVLQQCLLLLFINQFEEQKIKYQKVFQNLDVDYDGKISKNECLSLYPDKEEQINSLFNLLSLKDKMDFQEFLVISVDRTQLLTSQNIETIFNLYATVKKFLLLQTLVNLYKSRENELQEAFSEYDHAHINFKTFETLLTDLL
ncbi:unnamed protein product [Paramecium pentaurelia]|uniref:Calcium-dependent protein kinase n=1 Tax=Paramecium pentaurelia TaxID=43138 RepID=A0A8S1Y2Z6_9CILI|nr:unnamed protein product [Paramecium pentaurelia]